MSITSTWARLVAWVRARFTREDTLIKPPSIGTAGQTSPINPPVWSTIPNYTNKLSGFTADLASYLDDKGQGLSMSLVGSVTGWSLVGTVLTCAGVGSGSLAVRVTYQGTNYDSNTFSVQSVSGASDTWAPTIPVGLRNIGTTSAPVLAWFQSNDPSVAGVRAGRKDYKLKNNGSTTDTITTTSGLAWEPAAIAIGSALSGVTVSQVGADLQLACTGGTCGSTADRFPGLGAPVTLGSFTRVVGYIDTWVSSWLYSKLTLMLRKDTTAGSPHIALHLFPFSQAQGGSFEYRSTQGGDTQFGTHLNLSGNTRLWYGFEISGGTSFQPIYGFDGNSFSPLGSAIALNLGASPYVLGAIASDDGVSAVSATIKQVSVQQDADATVTPTVVAGNTYQWTLTARDNTPNESAASQTFTLTIPGGGDSTNHGYPRKSVYGIGGGQGGDQGYNNASDRDLIATCQFAVLGGDNDGFYPNASGMTRQQVHDDIIARALTKGIVIELGQYFIISQNNYPTYRYARWDAAVISADWWLYQSGASGAKTRVDPGPPTYVINWTHFCNKKDGLYPWEWGAYFMESRLTSSADGAANASTNCKHRFEDNLWWYVNKYDADNADLSRTNSSATLDDWRLGESDLFTYGRSIAPTKGWGGNTSNLANTYDGLGGGGVANLSHMVNQCDNGILEFTLGEHSKEADIGTALWLGMYKYAVDNIMRNTDSRLIVQVNGLDSNGRDSRSSTNGQGWRYAWACCAMGPGYLHDDLDGDIHWVVPGQTLRDFDENKGGSLNQIEWLGQPLEAQQASPRLGSVYYRDFENGRVYLNTRGAGPVSIDLTGFQRLIGSYWPTINNGAVGGTYVLPGGDGIAVRRI